MADDLKPMLTKVLASEGKKKFFFAYGAGKRKDGKGDGELVVRGKKPKKQEVEGALVDCKEVLEGVCWVGNRPDNNKTIYFQGRGKKLSPMIVAKMALTAKRATGRQFDFQLPSPEEEARADKVAEGDADGTAAAPTPPPSPAKPVDLQARLKSLLLRVKSANATAPDLKGTLGPLAQAAAGRVQRGSADAAQALDALEAALRAPVAARFAGLAPALKAALAARGPGASRIRELAVAVTGLLKTPESAQAGKL